MFLLGLFSSSPPVVELTFALSPPVLDLVLPLRAIDVLVLSLGHILGGRHELDLVPLGASVAGSLPSGGKYTGAGASSSHVFLSNYIV